MRYTVAPASNPLMPHMYVHQFRFGSYLVVRPKKGHSTIFAVREGFSIKEAVAACRRRGFAVDYAITARQRTARRA
jgi:hypothetical protein